MKKILFASASALALLAAPAVAQNNTSAVDQLGSNNDAEVTQTGSFNTSDIDQNGQSTADPNNDATVKQAGTNGYSKIDQTRGESSPGAGRNSANVEQTSTSSGKIGRAHV